MTQFNIKTAFLYADLDEELYMEQPPGYSSGENKVCLLQKGLYGLKQAPRQWNKKFDSFLVQFGFNRCDADKSIYFSKKEDQMTLLALYIDDGLLCSSSNEYSDEVIR